MHAITQEEYDAMVASLNAKLEKYGQPKPAMKCYPVNMGVSGGVYCLQFPKDCVLKPLKTALSEFAKELGCRKKYEEYMEVDESRIAFVTHPLSRTPEDYRREEEEAKAEEKAEEKRKHEAWLKRQAEDEERARTLFDRLKAGKLRSRVEDGFLVMQGEFYDDIESGEKTVETREFTEYNLKRTIGIKTIRLQRGYGHLGKPPKKMRYEVTQVLLMDDYGQECAPFDIPEDFIPVYINLHLGKRID